MKTIVPALVCGLLFFSSSLSASPKNPPIDSLCVNPEPAGAIMPPTFIVYNDVCGLGGAIDLTPDPNTPGPHLYMWSNGATTQDLSDLSPGMYSVTIMDGNFQIQIAQIVVQTGQHIGPMSVTSNITGNTICGGQGNGAIDITVVPPNFFTYQWSNGATTEDISNLDPGTYTVSVTYGVTCITPFTFVVPNLTNAPQVIMLPLMINWTSDICEQGNGSAWVMVQGGVQPYSYLWSNGGTTSTITNLVAGTYDVTITGANGCSTTSSVTVPAQTYPVSITSYTITPNTTCNGSNGSITIDVQPFVLGGYTYLWSNGATTQNLTNAPPGSYQVTVTRAGTCTAREVFYIEHEPVLPGLDFVNTPATCGMPNGAINLTPLSGGVPPYTYQWSNGATTEDISNLPAGTYQVTLTGGNLCTATGTAVIEDTEVVYSYSANVTNHTSCDTTNGSISLSLFPNTLTYQWSTGTTSKTLVNLAPGDYTVTVSAGGTCTAVETYTVADLTQYPQLPIKADTTYCGLPSGTIDLTVIGDATPMKYVWSTGATTEDLANLPAGTYSVTVTSAVGCSNTRTIVIPNINPPIGIAGNVLDNLSCTTPTGSIALNVTPADTLYVFAWSSGDTIANLANLTAGEYAVTVTLGVSCVASDTFVIVDNALPPDLALASNAATCGLDNGSADLTVNTGVGPYTYLWSNSAITEDLANLPPGNYSVTVTGANQCTAVSSVNVANTDAPPNIAGTAFENTVCGTGNGALDLSVAPAGAYAYAWSNGATTEDLNNLPAGAYTVTVTLGTCTSSGTFSVADNTPAPTLASSAAASICGENNGAIDLTATGPAAPFTFLWSNGAQAEDISGLLPGNYSVTVTGANQCTAVSNINVPNTNVPLNIAGTAVENTACGFGNGALDISISPAGTYAYAWSNGAATEDLSGLPAGSYTVTVTWGTCVSSSVFVVGENAPNPVVASNVVASLCSQSNGAIELSVTGPAAPFAFLWSNNETSEDLSGILSGTYTVTVTASNGCTAVESFNVPNNASTFSLAGSAVALTNCAASNGSIDLTVSPPGAYAILWSNGEITEDLSGLASGIYTVSVTESGNCTATASFVVVDQRVNPVASSVASPEVCGLANGSISLSVGSGTGPYSFSWSNGLNSQNLTNLSAGSYTVTVTDANGCTVAELSNVPGNSIAFSLAGAAQPNTSCASGNGTVTLNLNPPNGSYTYLWSTGSTSSNLSGMASGTYSVTVSAGGNCIETASFVVPQNVVIPNLSGTSADATSCVVNNGAIDLSVSPLGAYTFLWSEGSVSEDLSGIAAGTYTVTVTGSGSCTSTAVFLVNSNTGVVATNGQITSVLCFGANTGAIDLTVNSGTAPFNYAWSGVPDNVEDPSNLGAGTYTVTVTDANGCTSTASFVVAQPPALQLQCAVTNLVSEPGFTDGSAAVNISGGTGPYLVDWSLGSTPTPVPAGNFPLANLGENNYTVTVTDANGCPSTCGFAMNVANCATVVGTMGTSALSLCGSGCLTATYNASGQVLGPNDLVQFVLHQGNGAQIINEIARSNQPTFCFDPATMSYGTTYYISAIAGVGNNGNVNVNGYCTVASQGTPIQFKENPVASAIPPASITCAAAQVTLMGNSSLPNATYLWSTANGNIAGNPAQANATAGAAGTYQLAVTVNGCSSTATVTVASLVNNPQANIVAPVTTLDCALQSVSLNGQAMGTGNGLLSWSSNGNVLASGPTLSVSAPGTYQLTVLDTVSFCTASSDVSIGQNLNLPALSVATPAVLTCAAPTQQLLGSSTVPNVQFSWANIVGADTTWLAVGPNLTVSAPGTYFLIGLNPANQCQNATPVTVSANQTLPVANAGSTFELDCAGETASLNGSGSSGAPNLSYLWSTSDGHIVSGGATATPLIDEPGTYTLLVTNPANGCTASAAVVITPEIPVAYASVVQPQCQGQKGTIWVDSVTGLSQPMLFALGNGLPGTQTQFSNLSPGVYTISVQGGNGCTASVTATVAEAPLFAVSMASLAEIALGYNYQIEAQVNIPLSEIASISWTPAEGLSCTDCLDPIAMPVYSTQYTVVVKSNAGCEARGTFRLTVDNTRKIYAPNIFSPNGDGRNELFALFGDPVSVTKVRSLRVYSRWGEEVFEMLDFSPDGNRGWDGTFRGQALNPAVFVWQAVVEFVDGKAELFTGDVTLQR